MSLAKRNSTEKDNSYCDINENGEETCEQKINSRGSSGSMRAKERK